MIKAFHSNLIFVNDLKRTAEFYKKLGFELKLKGDVAKIKLGYFTFAFMDENKATIKNESGMKPKGLGVYFYIEVDDVDKYFAAIKKKGVVPRTKPKDHPWGKRELVVRDPDGYKLVFYS